MASRPGHLRAQLGRAERLSTTALGRFRFFNLREEVPQVVGNILLRQAQRKQWSEQPASNAAEVADRQDLHMAATSGRRHSPDFHGATGLERLDFSTVPFTIRGSDQSYGRRSHT